MVDPRAERRRMAGSTSLELALLAPVLALAVVGGLDLGRAVWVKHSLMHLAGEVARQASVRSTESESPATESDLIAWAKAQAQAESLDKTKLVVSAAWAPNQKPGAVVHVDVRYTFLPTITIPDMDSFTLTASARRILTY